MKKCKKYIVHGLLAGLMMLVVGMLAGWIINMLFPGLATQYESSQVLRPMNDPLMIWYFVYFFVLGIGIAWLWEMLKDKVKGKTACQRAKYLIVRYWPAILLPGMMITYSSFQMSFAVIASWSVTSFVQLYAGFWVLAKKNK